jgi:hypothetical protein
MDPNDSYACIPLKKKNEKNKKETLCFLSVMDSLLRSAIAELPIGSWYGSIFSETLRIIGEYKRTKGDRDKNEMVILTEILRGLAYFRMYKQEQEHGEIANEIYAYTVELMQYLSMPNNDWLVEENGALYVKIPFKTKK